MNNIIIDQTVYILDTNNIDILFYKIYHYGLFVYLNITIIEIEIKYIKIRNAFYVAVLPMCIVLFDLNTNID